jgi:uncharacterized protein
VIEVTENLLNEMTRILVKEIKPDKIILFGSHANGLATSDSDLDLMIIVPQAFSPNQTRKDEIMRIRRILSKFHIAKDILVFSTDEVSKWMHSANHIIGHALRDGKVLYARH